MKVKKKIFEDYLQRDDMNLPSELEAILSTPITDFGEGFEALRKILPLIDYYLPIRLEVCISLLNAFDLVEIRTLPVMVPSQKSEWAWHCYNLYFKAYLKVLDQAKSRYDRDTEEIEGQYRFLAATFPYEWEKRRSVLEKGGLHNIRRTLNKIKVIIA